MFNPFKKKPQPQPTFGFIEVPRQRGELYRAEGRLRQSPGFKHTITCSIIPVPRTGVGQDLEARRRYAIAFIRDAERRGDIKILLAELFDLRPNVWITFEATPNVNVGQRRVLLYTGLHLQRQDFYLPSLASDICRYALAGIAEELEHSMLQYLLLDRDFVTHFWITSILRYTARRYGLIPWKN